MVRLANARRPREELRSHSFLSKLRPMRKPRKRGSSHVAGRRASGARIAHPHGSPNGRIDAPSHIGVMTAGVTFP